MVLKGNSTLAKARMDSGRSDASVLKNGPCDLLPVPSRQHLIQAGPELITLIPHYLQLFAPVVLQLLNTRRSGRHLSMKKKKEKCHY